MEQEIERMKDAIRYLGRILAMNEAREELKGDYKNNNFQNHVEAMLNDLERILTPGY